MASVLTDNRCVICGIPLDAEFFDVSGLIGKPLGKRPGDEALVDPFGDFREFEPIADLPRRGEQKVLATFQLHVQYCGAITYFSQYTDLYMRDNSQIQTPGFEWLIIQNGKPVFPYTRLERIINPWGYNCFPIFIRLDENAKVEFVIRNRSVPDERLDKDKYPMDKDKYPMDKHKYPIKAFAGRIMGRYWYNDVFGRRVR